MENREVEALNKIKYEASLAWIHSDAVDGKSSSEFTLAVNAICKIVDDAINAEIARRKQNANQLKGA